MLSDEDKTWIDDRFAGMTERMEAMETRLVTEFHRWAQTYEVRARGTSMAVAEFDERLGLVEERLSRLERGNARTGS